MNEALFSPLWHEVATLKPAFRLSVHRRRLRARGEIWHVLWSDESHTQLRINDAAWRLIGLFTGQHSVDELWQGVWARDGEAAPSQPEVLELLEQLDRAGFMRSDSMPDFSARYEEAARRAGSSRLAALNPLSVRVHLFDPSAWLDRLSARLPHAFGLPALIVWLTLVGITALMAAADLPALSNALANGLSAPRFVFIAWVVYPLMKAAHELAHGVAIHHWGGRVHSAGFTLLVLVPVPHVDAGAASTFSRHRRFVVSAAGVMTELLIAAFAWWVWDSVSPGLVQDIALTAFFIGAVSSLLFNGNPLLRFDGYHMFTDALDLPNLASRSRRWWLTAIGRRVFAAPLPPLQISRGEGLWLWLYAPASAIFQLVIGVRIAHWIAGYSPILGIVALLGLGYAVIVAPVWRSVQHWRAHDRSHTRSPTRRRLWLGAALLAGFVAAVPLPSATLAPGVLDLPEHARLRAQTAGFVEQLLAKDGDTVAPGQAIAVLDDPDLRLRHQTLRAELDGLSARRYTALLSDPKAASDLIESIHATESELAEVQRRIDALTLRAASAGQLVIAHATDLPGVWLHEGDTLGYVLGDAPLDARAVVPDRVAARVRAASKAVEVRLASQGEALPAHVGSMSAGAQQTLPSPALSARLGGPVAVTGEAHDDVRSIEPLYEVRVRLDGPRTGWIGERVWVRFAHAPEPLLVQWSREARQLLLRWFNGSGVA